jgi:hypothetical protein
MSSRSRSRSQGRDEPAQAQQGSRFGGRWHLPSILNTDMWEQIFGINDAADEQVEERRLADQENNATRWQDAYLGYATNQTLIALGPLPILQQVLDACRNQLAAVDDLIEELLELQSRRRERVGMRRNY